MTKLTYIAITSLDGFIEDDSGGFDWAAPDSEVHAFINELIRPAGTYLYGRRMYETMAVWQDVGTEPGAEVPPTELDFAELWRAADKVVYSRTLEAVPTPRTRVEREFDAEGVQRLKDSADRELAIGGPDIARPAFAAGLIDDIHLLMQPLVVGGGKPGLPRGPRFDLELRDERRFASGVVYLHYARR